MWSVCGVCCAVVTLWAGVASARADIVLTRQSGSIIVSGSEGTVQDFAPEATPWSRSLQSGATGAYVGQATVGTQWSAGEVVVDTHAAVTPGGGSPVLTQALVQVDMEFELTAAADVEVRFDVGETLGVPTPAYVFTTTRVVDLTTFNELMTTPGVYHLSLPAGPFRLEVQTIVGNLEDNLPLGASVRNITGTFRVLQACDVDFNNDGLFPDTQDIADFLDVFAGGACPTGVGACDSVDFNHDEIFPDTQDITDFLAVFAGGAC